MVKKIIATQGEEILVDEEDYPILSRFRWSLGGKGRHPLSFLYLPNDDSVTVYMHQIIMGGIVRTDHKDGNPCNMQKDNLRAATRSQNGANARKMKTRAGKPLSSQYKGVHFSKTAAKYRAVIKCEGKVYRCGSYNNENEAARAYNRKAMELFGEYALLNVINLGCPSKG